MSCLKSSVIMKLTYLTDHQVCRPFTSYCLDQTKLKPYRLSSNSKSNILLIPESRLLCTVSFFNSLKKTFLNIWIKWKMEDSLFLQPLCYSLLLNSVTLGNFRWKDFYFILKNSLRSSVAEEFLMRNYLEVMQQLNLRINILYEFRNLELS